ncbi:Metalloendoproteinase 1-MMP [Quillaja saponaria]|uniref:Metalloendoproteinase 1-MMP n=1 Tax=Quillaja saponaria TaxID=32244 RepID=A0AAD7PXQ5_QUISA|nr:Metalloendoproteinase 1-MMP [Quillaja saponaria]
MATIHLNRFCFGAFLLILFTAQPALLVHSKHLHPAKWPSFKNLEGSQKGLTAKGIQDVKNYLRTYEYLEDNNIVNCDNDHFDDSLEIALKKFQVFYKLDVTGKLDSGTIKQMNTPRCGISDKDLTTVGNVLRYSFFPGLPRWPLATKSHLLYSLDVITNAPAVSLEIMRYVSTEAFNQWASVTSFTFEETAGDIGGDLYLGFMPFDGPHKLIAYSYSPPNGTLHFDVADKFSADEPPAKTDFDFIGVALHEIGHLLGLQHSTEESAIMYAYITPGVNKHSLSQDDIDGIHTLYSLPPP